MKKIVWCVFVLGAVSAATEVVVTRVGHNVRMDCKTVKFRQLFWYHSGVVIVTVSGRSGASTRGTADVEKRAKVIMDTQLQITGVTEADAGNFKCTADGRTTSEYRLLVVSISVIPSPALQVGSEARLQCQVRDVDSSVKVQWKRPDEQLSDSQEVQLKAVTMADNGTWECAFKYGLKVFSESITIKVEDKKLEPTTSAPVTRSGSDAPSSGVIENPAHDGVQLLGLSWWVWVAVGVGGLVSLLLLVFAIILCQKIRRKKRRKYLRVKNATQPLKPRKYCECNRPTAAAKPQQGRRREKPSPLPL